MARCASVLGFALVAARCWLAVRTLMAAELRNVVALTLHESGSLRSRYVRIRGHRPRYARPPRIPTVCHGHPVQIFLLSISLEQAQIRLFVKIFAERGGFEPPKPFWSLHAFQACLFNHSSISPSSQLACKKKLVLRVWLAAVAPLKSNPRGSIYFLFGP